MGVTDRSTVKKGPARRGGKKKRNGPIQLYGRNRLDHVQKECLEMTEDQCIDALLTELDERDLQMAKLRISSAY